MLTDGTFDCSRAVKCSVCCAAVGRVLRYRQPCVVVSCVLTGKKLTNDHMWLSVVSRPTRSSFSRVQRVSCCVSLLFLTMITNCMFFQGDDNQENVQVPLHVCHNTCEVLTLQSLVLIVVTY